MKVVVTLPRGARGRDRAAQRPRIGEVLTSRRWLTPERLNAALALQRIEDLPLGRLLTAKGWSDEECVAIALAEQHGLPFADLTVEPPDPALLEPDAAAAYLALGLIPWRRDGAKTLYATTDPERIGEAVAALGKPLAEARAAVASRRALEDAVAQGYAEPLARRAATRTPRDQSVRSLGRARAVAGGAVLVLLALVFLGGPIAAALALGTLLMLNAATSAVRIAALIAGRVRPDRSVPPAPALAARKALPRISLLVPLYREAGMVREIIAALDALDYPRARLEVRLLLEDHDKETQAAVARTPLPPWIKPLVVPAGRPRTKPRALNYALDFCQGEIIGILDVEDRPDPGQLRAVSGRFAVAPPELTCLQCQLAYHNARDTWITRCFQIEYAIWFDVLLRGYEALDLPIPLGGTSVYFRRQALVELGAWDAHNVTEDADLGMRLARAGQRVAVLRSVTLEEANCRAWPWIRQRSRWLKGYLLTWLNHMRDPRQLYRDLGLKGFLSLNILFLGAVASYLAIPLFWAAVIGWAVAGASLWPSALPGWLLGAAGISLGIGQAIMVGCAALAMMRRGETGLLLWVPSLPVYWTLGALAAWKAVLEVLVAPFWWDKTRHGTSRTLRAQQTTPS